MKYIIVLISLVFISCNFDNSADMKNNSNSVIYQPKEIIKSDNTSIEIYDYMGLKQIMNTDNDTLYIFNFWATWCKPCIEELPDFELVGKEYKNQKIKLILVSLDFSKNIASKLIPFIKNNNIESKVILLSDSNSDFWINDIDNNWSGAIPSTFFKYKDKTLFIEGKMKKEEIVEIINKLK